MSDVTAASMDESSVALEADPSTVEPTPVPELPGQLTFGWGDDAAPRSAGKRKKSKKAKALKPKSETTDSKVKPSKAKRKSKKAIKRKPEESSRSVDRTSARTSKSAKALASKDQQDSIVSSTSEIAATNAVAPLPADAKSAKKTKSTAAKTTQHKVTKKKKPVRDASLKSSAGKRTAVKSASVKSETAQSGSSSDPSPSPSSHDVSPNVDTKQVAVEAVLESRGSVLAAKPFVKCHADAVDSLSLKWGAKLPSVGFGFWKVEKDQTAQVCYDAIRVGYRHLDCACDYGNEEEVGQGIRQAICDGLVEREDLWVTSKLWNTYHSPEHVRMACEKSLSDLQLDYLDLYLIHFPLAQRFVPIETRYPPGWFFDPDASSPVVEEARVPVQATWQAMEELTKEGLVRNIGICNFGTSQIRDLLTYAHIRPAVLQVETHPRLTQPKLLRYCQQEKIAYTAFSPLGAQSYYSLNMADQSESLLSHPVVTAIAKQVQRTAAQVLLRWGVQRGTAVIPKTSSMERMVENICVFDFQLSGEHMQQLDGLDEGRRFNDPGDFGEAAFNTYLPIYE